MKSFFLQFVFAGILILIVLNIAEAPEGLFLDHGESEKNLTIAFTGDSMLGRNVEVLMDRDGHDYPFNFTSDIFNKADFVITNLEGPIPLKHVRTISGQMSFSFPAYVPQLMYKHGIHAVSLANNHTYDKGREVYEETVQALQQAHIGTFGHPTIQSSSYSQHYVINNIPFTLIGFNATFPSFILEEAVQAIRETKTIYPEGNLIVFIHWGDEYDLVSNVNQRNIANSLHDAGANLIIGAHPHVVQDIICESINRCTIFSLGNFIFDQYFSKDVEEGMVAYITVDDTAIKQIEIVPIEGNHSQPQIMAENRRFLEALLTRSTIRNIVLSTSTATLLLKPE